MTSSTPSPSAQELGDKLDNIAKHDCACSYAKALRLSATLLRRLSETERERDEARTLLDAEMLRCPDATALTCAQVWGVPPRWAMHHIDTDKALAAAEAERDALREMLAQADAAHAYEQWTIDGKGAAPMTQEEYYQRYDEARHRHRLSQKGK